MTYKVPLTEMRIAFARAHSALIAKYNPTTRERAMQYWQTEYNIAVHYNPGWGQWESVEFPDEHEYLLFVMRWI